MARQLAGGAAASAGLMILFVVSAAWIFIDVAPRFQSGPLSLPLQHTVWDGLRRPDVASIEPGDPVELGVAVRPMVAGAVVGLRFYKIRGDDGPHVGSLWTRKGNLLATVKFENETESGWQEAMFATPVEVEANRVLVASYFAPTGGQLVADPTILMASPPRVSYTALFLLPPIPNNSRPANTHRFGEPGFPSTDAGNLHYWVDVVFVPESPEK